VNLRTRFALSLVACMVATSAGAQISNLSVRPSARINAKIDSKVTTSIPQSHPAVVAQAQIGTRLSPNTQLQDMVLVLKASDDQEAALANLLDTQQDKGSPNFHKWLTPDIYANSFGVAPADVALVTAWLADNGLPVKSVSHSGRFIVFSGTVGAVETAFHTEMRNLTVSGEGHISNVTDLSVPTALLPVVHGVARLNDFFPKSNAAQNWRKVTTQANAKGNVTVHDPAVTSSNGVNHYIGAADLATIYNAGPLTSAGIDGTGVTISVLAQSNISLADVETYRTVFGLPKNDPQVIVVGSDPGVNGDDIEAALDAEMAGSLAGNATVKFIVSGVSAVGGGIDTAALHAVDNNIGDIITLSYGGCETNNAAAGTAFWNTLWEEAAAQGQTVFVSTGDSGAAGCSSSSAATGSAYGVNALGSSAFNVAVGGSMFVDFGPAQYWGPSTGIPYQTATGYIPEATWNEGAKSTTLLSADSTTTLLGAGIAGGGGGVSIFTARPSWQTGSGIGADPTGVSGTGRAAPIAGSLTTGLHRLVPDISFIAAGGHDGTVFCVEGVCSETAAAGLGGFGVVGGTSVATPAMASAQALINQKNGGRQGNADYYYYQLGNAQYAASTTACQSVNGTPGNPTVVLPAANCNFHDIVAGSNVIPTSNSQLGFLSAVGFDAASGLGSMNIANVANNWSSVSFHSSSTSFSLSPTSVAHGATQAISIQVTATSGTPTGDVSVIASSIAGEGAPLVFTLSNGGVAGNLSTPLPGGTYTVHAHYAGDGVYAPSDSAPISVTISKENSSIVGDFTATGVGFGPFQAVTVVNGSANNFLSGASVGYGVDAYMDTQLISASSKGTPSGSVTYTVTQNGSPLPSLTTNLNADGTTFMLTGTSFPNNKLVANYATLLPGAYSVTASYAGDNSFNPSTASTTFTINKATPSVTYSTSSTELTSGGTATLNFAIAIPGLASAATGTVTFSDGATPLGTGTLSNGRVTFTTTAIVAAGAHSIHAVYNGDSLYNTATPNNVTITVGGTVTTTTALTAATTTVTAPLTPPTAGSSITLTAIPTPAPSATTSVSFYDNGVFLGSANATVATGKATLAVTTLTAGMHNLTANYSGNTTQQTSTGSLTLVVAQNATSTTIDGGLKANFGQTLIFNGSISRAVSSQTAPVLGLTGLVRFYEGSTSGTLLGQGTPIFGPTGYGLYYASFSTSSLSVGSHTIVAAYSGDANYTASNSIAIPVTINKLDQTINFAALPTAVMYGAGPYALSATASSGLPVSFSVSGPASLSGNTLTITGVGTVVVTASQAGNGNYNAAPSVVQTIVVGKASQTINFTGLPATVIYGSTAPITYTLNGTASSGLAVSYSVSGPATLSGHTLTLTGPGTVSVTATQAGNSLYNAATPVTQTIVVGSVQLTPSTVITKVGSTYQAVITVKNTGNVTAPNVQLTAATLGAANGSPIPASFGNIAGGGSATMTITFPGSAGSSGAGVVEKLTGTYTGGTFGGSFRATLP
jgi:hypothetical protein